MIVQSVKRRSLEIKTAWESPCLLVPSSSYKTEIAIGPDSLSFSLESECMGKMRLLWGH